MKHLIRILDPKIREQALQENEKLEADGWMMNSEKYELGRSQQKVRRHFGIVLASYVAVLGSLGIAAYQTRNPWLYLVGGAGLVGSYFLKSTEYHKGRASGIRFSNIAKEDVFNPLGMALLRDLKTDLEKRRPSESDKIEQLPPRSQQ
ncbi:hypothetical protein HYT24_01985 [Candidatus Pacearchaeota archaeon]|nr:hypothetical protein [Candidatus Pacearchaeota archaeon]